MFVVMTHTNQPGSLSFFGTYPTKKAALTVAQSCENNGMFAVVLAVDDAIYATNTD